MPRGRDRVSPPSGRYDSFPGILARAVRAVAVLTVAVLVSACAKKAGPPPVDVVAEERAIREAGKAWLAAEIAKDVPTIVSFYAEDAVEMASNTPIIQGRDAIRQWYEAWLTPAGVSMTFETTGVQVAASGDMAIERGTYRFTQDSPRGRTEDVGKYGRYGKKVDGKVAGRDRHRDQRSPLPAVRLRGAFGRLSTASATATALLIALAVPTHGAEPKRPAPATGATAPATGATTAAAPPILAMGLIPWTPGARSR
jgi:ketosteroid isomerase-like protein